MLKSQLLERIDELTELIDKTRDALYSIQSEGELHALLAWTGMNEGVIEYHLVQQRMLEEELEFLQKHHKKRLKEAVDELTERWGS